MGVLTSGLNILGGLVNAGSTIAGTVDSIKTNQRNYDLQVENLAYQKDLQNKIFAREDNAVQRRVADLKAAGLSPTLAAGSSAGVGSVVSTSAPQKKSNLEALTALASVKTLLAQQQKAQTEADIAKNQLEQDKLDTKYFKSKGISPVESRMGYQQLLTNVLNGLLTNPVSTAVGTVSDLAKANANANPNPPKEISKNGDVTNQFGNTLTSAQVSLLKQKGLYMAFLNGGFTDDVVKALRGK